MLCISHPHTHIDTRTCVYFDLTASFMFCCHCNRVFLRMRSFCTPTYIAHVQEIVGVARTIGFIDEVAAGAFCE